MGSGCCKKTKIADLSVGVMQAQNMAATEIPYGYVFIYSGILTPNQTYTCPMLSIHTYHQSLQKTLVDYAEVQFSNKKKSDGLLGPLAALKEEYLSSDETVVMIPVEDVISIYYTCDVKKSVKTQEHSRVVPVATQKGCCGSCCCKQTPELPRRTKRIEEKDVQRVITIHLQYSKYSYLDTVSNARVLPESDRAQFYKNQFQPKAELKFYLVRNTEYDSANFDQKKRHAENLCRVIMQLKGINGGVTGSSLHPATDENVRPSAALSYPSPQELQQILKQPHFSIFGDLYEERLHSIQTQHDFGTHVPVPVATTTVATIAMRPTDTRPGNKR